MSWLLDSCLFWCLLMARKEAWIKWMMEDHNFCRGVLKSREGHGKLFGLKPQKQVKWKSSTSSLTHQSSFFICLWWSRLLVVKRSMRQVINKNYAKMGYWCFACDVIEIPLTQRKSNLSHPIFMLSVKKQISVQQVWACSIGHSEL